MPARQIFANQDDTRITLHFLAQRFVDRLTIAFLRHAPPPMPLLQYWT